MACKTTCCKCGLKFDRFSGKLINISDEGLKEFYSLSFIQEYLKDTSHKHPTLCSDCLIELLGRDLSLNDIKFKNGKWMTSNVAYLINKLNKSQSYKDSKIEKLRDLDSSGILPFKHPKDDRLMFSEFLT
jgi:hypothetical protein